MCNMWGVEEGLHLERVNTLGVTFIEGGLYGAARHVVLCSYMDYLICHQVVVFEW
jgi:hypothetical protein